MTSETYRYDDLGNRVDRESVVGSANRLRVDATHGYEYDAAGNVVLKYTLDGGTTGPRWAYGWDHRGRLLSVEYEAGTTPSADDYWVEYVYDGLDRLVARRETRNPGAIGGASLVSTTGYAYDGARRVLELDLDTRVARFDYLDGPTGELAAVESTWLLNDPSGSASTLARYDAASHWLASHRDFDAFGDSRAWGVSLVDADTDVTDAEDRRVLGNEADFFAEYPRVYQGGYWDEGAGLYELGGSWYDPLTGRFAQDRGGENGYAFAGDAPNRSRLVGATDDSFSLSERTALYGSGVVGAINYGVGEGLRSTLGDEYVSGAGLIELQGVLFAGGVVGAVAGLEVATLATAYSLGTVGAAVLAGGAGGAAEYLGTTLTASAFNSALGRGGDPGPTLGGLAVATAGGALTGGALGLAAPLAGAARRGLASGAQRAAAATRAFTYDVAAPLIRQGADFLSRTQVNVGGVYSVFPGNFRITARAQAGAPWVVEALEKGELTLRRALRRGEVHHIASPEDKTFAPQFAAIFRDAGLDLQSPFNRTRLSGHAGPHGKYVNALVLRRLRDATGSKIPGTTEFRGALLDELWKLRRDVQNTDFGNLLRAPASKVDVTGRF